MSIYSLFDLLKKFHFVHYATTLKIIHLFLISYKWSGLQAAQWEMPASLFFVTLQKCFGPVTVHIEMSEFFFFFWSCRGSLGWGEPFLLIPKDKQILCLHLVPKFQYQTETSMFNNFSALVFPLKINCAPFAFMSLASCRITLRCL